MKKNMKHNVKKIVVVTSALMALSGCLDDNFDYGGSGNSGTTPPEPPAGGEVTQIYGEGSADNFAMQAVDKDAATADVDGKEGLPLSNIQVVGDYQNQGTLNVTVTESDKAAIQFVSNSAFDFSAAESNGSGTLIFDVKVNEHTKISTDTDTVNPITVTLKSDDDAEASVDITSSINAFLGAKNYQDANDTQSVKIPLTCFSGQGVDLTKITQSFSMQMSSNINYDISNIRLQAESGGDTPGIYMVQECVNGSEVLTDEESTVFARTKNAEGTYDKSGWAKSQAITGKGTFPSAPPEMTEFADIGFFGVESIAEAGKNTFLTLSLNKDVNLIVKDLSQYLEHGALQFYLWMEKDSDMPHPTGIMIVKMETPKKNDEDGPAGAYNYPISNLIALSRDEYIFGEKNIYRVNIPLAKFFTKSDGSIDINALQHVKKIVLHPELSEDKTYAPKGMRFHAADVKLVMNPTEE